MCVLFLLCSFPSLFVCCWLAVALGVCQRNNTKVEPMWETRGEPPAQPKKLYIPRRGEEFLYVIICIVKIFNLDPAPPPSQQLVSIPLFTLFSSQLGSLKCSCHRFFGMRHSDDGGAWVLYNRNKEYNYYGKKRGASRLCDYIWNGGSFWLNGLPASRQTSLYVPTTNSALDFLSLFFLV